MELEPISIQASLALLAFLFFVIKLLKDSSNGAKTKLPPGPRKLPIIGNMNQFLGSMPHKLLRDLAEKYGPIMHLKLGQVRTIVVSSSEVSKEIMRTRHDLIFSNRPKMLSAEILAYGYTDVGYAPYGAYRRQMKKIELLTAPRVQSFRSAREEEVSLLVSSIASASLLPVNMTEKLFSLAHDITSKIAFGRKNPDPRRFREVMKEGVALAGGFDIGDFFPSLEFIRAISGMKSRLERNFAEFDKIMSEIIEGDKEKDLKDASEHEDLVDVFLRVQMNSNLEIPFTNDNIKAVILVCILHTYFSIIH